MPTVLKLTDSAVKMVARHAELTGLKLIGRGAFCAVYDKGDTVMKLTCDPIQYGFARDAYRPEGPFFARLVADHGDIGETSDGRTLYLFEVEKLSPLRRNSASGLRKLARRLLKATSDSMWSHSKSHYAGTYVDQRKYTSVNALQSIIDSGELPRDLCDALEQVRNFVSNYDAMIDFHSKNLMLRGEQLILNDVVADAAQVQKMWQKFV